MIITKLTEVLIRFLFALNFDNQIRKYDEQRDELVLVKFEPFINEELNFKRALNICMICMFFADFKVKYILHKLHKDIENFEITSNYLLEFIKVISNNIPYYIDRFNEDNNNKFIKKYDYYSEFNLFIHNKFEEEMILYILDEHIISDNCTFLDIAYSIDRKHAEILKEEYNDLFGYNGLFEDLIIYFTIYYPDEHNIQTNYYLELFKHKDDVSVDCFYFDHYITYHTHIDD